MTEGLFKKLPISWQMNSKLMIDLKDWIAHIGWIGNYRHAGDLFTFITVREGNRFRTEARDVADMLALLIKEGVLIPSKKDEGWHWVAHSRGAMEKSVAMTPGLQFDALRRSYGVAESPAGRDLLKWAGDDPEAWYQRMTKRKEDWAAFKRTSAAPEWRVGF